jgi:hypothetical protein
LYQVKQQAHPAVQARLIAAVEAVLPGGLDGLDAQQVSDALEYVTFLMGRRRSCSRTLTALPGGFFGTPPCSKPWAKPLARTSAASSRLQMIVQGWLLRWRAAFSMSAQALGRWR